MEPQEGYIKFQCHWNQTALNTWNGCESLDAFIECRQNLMNKNWIGMYTSGPYKDIGFGNLSIRAKEPQSELDSANQIPFHITGSATGGIKDISLSHIPLVQKYQIETNEVYCQGETKASSETMSHAIIYDTLSEVNAILHIHEKELWDLALDSKDSCRLKKTPKETPYGTPEMAYAIRDTIIGDQSNISIDNTDQNSIRETSQSLENDIKDDLKIIIMAGHEEGIIAYGKSLNNAFHELVILSKTLLATE